jgi:hypothetical protein
VTWDWRTERNARHRFVEERLQHRKPFWAVTFIFCAVWLTGWACSAVLKAQGMDSMPLRYAISWVVSYLMFFWLVRIWCDYAAKPVSVDAGKKASDGGLPGDIPIVDGEGCLIVVAILVVFMALSGIFWIVGGYALLLEVAFEVAFAGTLVSGLRATHRVGGWARTLFRRTLLPALLVGAMLVCFADKMQRDHPGAKTMTQAFKAQRAQSRH